MFTRLLPFLTRAILSIHVWLTNHPSPVPLFWEPSQESDFFQQISTWREVMYVLPTLNICCIHEARTEQLRFLILGISYIYIYIWIYVLICTFYVLLEPQERRGCSWTTHTQTITALLFLQPRSSCPVKKRLLNETLKIEQMKDWVYSISGMRGQDWYVCCGSPGAHIGKI